MTSNLGTRLDRAMRRLVGEGQTSDLERLAGGANMESWAFNWAGQSYVLRRAPSPEFMVGRPLSHADEAAVVVAARAAGVKAPEVIGVLCESDELGTGYIMRRVAADVSPARILASPPRTLLTDIASELAKIHAVPPNLLPASIPKMDIAGSLRDLKRQFVAAGGTWPAIALAIRWCEDNLPEPRRAVLVHGDYRMGNIMSDEDGLAAVLDWELAHFGDPHEDLAFGCMTVWRFGRIDRPAFGLGGLEDLFAAYEAAGGEKVDPARFRFWLVYRTLWWALGCLKMGEAWRSGADRSLERPVVGRRVAEQELDLIMLLELEAPERERGAVRVPPVPDAPPPVGEPTVGELVEAVREWIDRAIKSRAEGHFKFEAAVAANALGIVLRDLASDYGCDDRELAEGLLKGSVTLDDEDVLARLRRNVLHRCAVNSPKYPGLQAALVAWT